MLRETAALLIALFPGLASAQPVVAPSTATSSDVAPATSPSARDAAAAFTIAPSFGLGVLPASQALDEALREARRDPLGSTVSSTVGVRFGVQVFGVSASASLGAFVVDKEDAPNATQLGRDWLFGELSYDVFPQAWLTFSPMLGAGAQITRVCLSGQPSGPATDGLFNQLLTNPGAETCLEQQLASARVGFIGGLALPLSVEDEVVIATFDLRPTVSWALADGSYQLLQQEDLPSFDGPSSPKTACSMLFELGFVFGLGQR